MESLKATYVLQREQGYADDDVPANYSRVHIEFEAILKEELFTFISPGCASSEGLGRLSQALSTSKALITASSAVHGCWQALMILLLLVVEPQPSSTRPHQTFQG